MPASRAAAAKSLVTTRIFIGCWLLRLVTDASWQRWRTHRCRLMSGMTSRHPRQSLTIWRCIWPTSATLHSRSSTSSSELSASLATCSFSSSSSCSSRSLRRYCRIAEWHVHQLT